MDQNAEKFRCVACPVVCHIRDGTWSACDRYANEGESPPSWRASSSP